MTEAQSADLVSSGGNELNHRTILLAPQQDQETHEEDARIRHWKESPFAVGLVDVTWADSRKRRPTDEHNSITTCSAWICPLVRAGRVGNMAVLKQSTEYVKDGVTLTARPRVDLVMGPYWIVPVLITYPLIVVVSLLTARAIVDMPLPMIIVWLVLTVALLTSLSMVACRNPGILYRYAQVPPDENENEWRWNDQARTFRPKGAKYDPECAVMVEGFDHT